MAARSRRTTSIDMVWQPPDEDAAVLHLAGAARDTVDATGDGTRSDRAVVDARLAADFSLVSLAVEPDRGDATALVGHVVRSGFRARAADAFPGAGETPLGQLLDDLPVAALIAGYASMRESARVGKVYASAATAPAMRDVCSGWRAGGTLLVSVEAGAGVPLQDCPPAPLTDRAPPPPGAMRRVRAIDVAVGDAGAGVTAMFRDTFTEPDGTEVVLHEYDVEAHLDTALVVTDIEATPRVLPYEECPAAAAHVHALVGVSARDLRRDVGQRLVGTSSCTHLNDLLRSLAALPYLIALAQRT